MSEVKVTIKGDLVINDTEVLDSLVQIVIGCGAEINIAPVVTQVQEATPTKRRSNTSNKKQEKPKPKAEEEPVEEPVEEPKVEKPKEEPKAEKPKEEPKAEPKQESETVTNDPFTEDDLMEKFTSLIDKDYDAALTLLHEYGVNTFHDLEESEYPAFHKKVNELLGAGA